VKRFGQRNRLRPDAVEAYEGLHAAPWRGVFAQIRRSHIRNHTTYRDGLDLFAAFEYVGEDFAADMAATAADPDTQR
jgi:L-rhamnose mutarotase